MLRLFNPPAGNWKIYTTSRLVGPESDAIGETGFSISYTKSLFYIALGSQWNSAFECLDGWWAVNLDPKAAIGEFGLAIHRNGLVSVMAIPRFGVSNRVKEHFQKFNVAYKTQDEDDLTDERFKLIATANHNELENLGRFISTTNAISPFSIELQQHIAGVFAKANQINYPDSAGGQRSFLKNWRDEFNFSELPDGFYHVGAHKLCPSSSFFFSPRYDSRFHRHFPTGRTELIQAIIANDFERVTTILIANPDSIFQPDAYAYDPFTLGMYRGNREMFHFLCHVVTLTETKCPRRKHQSVITFLCYLAIGDDYDNFLSSKYLESLYCKHEKSEAPKRPPLHQACATEDISRVLAILNLHPEQLNEKDPWCMTPLVIAIGERRADVVELLLQRGAIIVAQEFGGSYSALNNALDIETLKVILKYHANVNDITPLAHEAVRNNQLDVLRLLYRYGRMDKQDDSGLTPIELAMQKANQTGDFAALQFLLERRDAPVVIGPYDPDFKPEVVTLLEEHNRKVTETRRRLFERPKIRDIQLSPDKNELITTLVWNGQDIYSSIKSTASITANERMQIYDLYERTFTRRTNDSPQNRKAFLDLVLPDKREANVMVEVCKLGDRVLSFFSFQIMQGQHPTCGEFTLFDGKLAAVEDHYASLGLANFIFRVPLAMKMLAPDKPLFVYFKAIRPGFSWCMLPTVDCEVYPKYHADQNLVRHIVQMTGEDMPEPGVISAILRVSRQAPVTDQIKEYEDLAGNKAENALPIFWVVNHKSIKGYIAKLQFNGMTEHNITHTGISFQALMQHLNPTTPIPQPNNVRRTMQRL